MSSAVIILEYLKVLLSWPLVTAFLLIYFMRKFKGSIVKVLERSNWKGSWGSASFEVQKAEDKEQRNLPKVEPPKELISGTPTEAEIKMLQEKYQQAVALRAVWEYKYLNLFLVDRTKDVLHVIVLAGGTMNENVARNLFSSLFPPNNIEVVFNVLQSHFLIEKTGGSNSVLNVTPKGLEYDTWRNAI